MFQPARSLFATPEAHDDALRRLEEDPFYRARADRQARLEAAIRDLEWSLPWDNSRGTAKWLALLRRRRDAIAGEMAAMVADAVRTIEVTAVEHAVVPPVPLAPPGEAVPRRRREWKWP